VALIFSTVIVEKIGLLFFGSKNLFHPISCSKHLGNTLGTLFNQSIALKNAKPSPKPITTRNKKNLLELKIIFF
jgi:hypothetical protein